MANDRNGVLVAEGHGGVNIDIENISHGLAITQEAASARNRKTNYIKYRTQSDFSILTRFKTYQEFATFTAWLTEYVRKVTDGSAMPMRVFCPIRNFDRTGVPLSIPYGDAAAKVTYECSLQFTGAEDPTSINGNAFSKAYGSSVDPETNFMLPYGYQMTVFDPGIYIPPPLPSGVMPGDVGSSQEAQQETQNQIPIGIPTQGFG
jgi:hypothetical protein